MTEEMTEMTEMTVMSFIYVTYIETTPPMILSSLTTLMGRGIPLATSSPAAERLEAERVPSSLRGVAV
jgi:hypothetical protein